MVRKSVWLVDLIIYSTATKTKKLVLGPAGKSSNFISQDSTTALENHTVLTETAPLHCKARCSNRGLMRYTIPLAVFWWANQAALPILDFGDVIYKKASNTLLRKLDVVYHSAFHFVTKAPYTTHHCDLYALICWPSLHIPGQTYWLQVI